MHSVPGTPRVDSGPRSASRRLIIASDNKSSAYLASSSARSVATAANARRFTSAPRGPARASHPSKATSAPRAPRDGRRAPRRSRGGGVRIRIHGECGGARTRTTHRRARRTRSLSTSATYASASVSARASAASGGKAAAPGSSSSTAARIAARPAARHRSSPSSRARRVANATGAAPTGEAPRKRPGVGNRRDPRDASEAFQRRTNDRLGVVVPRARVCAWVPSRTTNRKNHRPGGKAGRRRRRDPGVRRGRLEDVLDDAAARARSRDAGVAAFMTPRGARLGERPEALARRPAEAPPRGANNASHRSRASGDAPERSRRAIRSSSAAAASRGRSPVALFALAASRITSSATSHASGSDAHPSEIAASTHPAPIASASAEQPSETGGRRNVQTRAKSNARRRVSRRAPAEAPFDPDE